MVRNYTPPPVFQKRGSKINRWTKKPRNKPTKSTPEQKTSTNGPTGQANVGSSNGPTGQANVGNGPTGQANVGSSNGPTGQANVGSSNGPTGQANKSNGPTGQANVGHSNGPTGRANVGNPTLSELRARAKILPNLAGKIEALRHQMDPALFDLLLLLLGDDASPGPSEQGPSVRAPGTTITKMLKADPQLLTEREVFLQNLQATREGPGRDRLLQFLETPSTAGRVYHATPSPVLFEQPFLAIRHGMCKMQKSRTCPFTLPRILTLFSSPIASRDDADGSVIVKDGGTRDLPWSRWNEALCSDTAWSPDHAITLQVTPSGDLMVREYHLGPATDVEAAVVNEEATRTMGDDEAVVFSEETVMLSEEATRSVGDVEAVVVSEEATRSVGDVEAVVVSEEATRSVGDAEAVVVSEEEEEDDEERERSLTRYHGHSLGSIYLEEFLEEYFKESS
ncbi:hypothetical protein HKI87_05g36580 [Chloropicon roscoffensis]|uniref:Uncharacterized protein n=1 Tax=Chloropicon roscoffensis TaxID=1461544 RepID=A0AAX4P712_9CHLO